MSATNKSSKFRDRDQKKSIVVKQIAARFNVTTSYVYMCVSDNPLQTPQADVIRREYNSMYKKLEAALA